MRAAHSLAVLPVPARSLRVGLVERLTLARAVDLAMGQVPVSCLTDPSSAVGHHEAVLLEVAVHVAVRREVLAGRVAASIVISQLSVFHHAPGQIQPESAGMGGSEPVVTFVSGGSGGLVTSIVGPGTGEGLGDPDTGLSPSTVRPVQVLYLALHRLPRQGEASSTPHLQYGARPELAPDLLVEDPAVGDGRRVT